MKWKKAKIREIRDKIIFIQIPDNADDKVAEAQYNAAFYGNLTMEDSDVVNFTDEDRDVDYSHQLIWLKEADMEKEEEYADRYYEYPDCIFWDEECNCITTGWYE